jgi:hypothetical protein
MGVFVGLVAIILVLEVVNLTGEDVLFSCSPLILLGLGGSSNLWLSRGNFVLGAVWVCDYIIFGADFGVGEVRVGEGEAASVHEPGLVMDGCVEMDS